MNIPNAEHNKRTKTNVMKPADPEMTHGMNFLPHKSMIGPKMRKIVARIQGFSPIYATIAVKLAAEQPDEWVKLMIGAQAVVSFTEKSAVAGYLVIVGSQ